MAICLIALLVIAIVVVALILYNNWRNTTLDHMQIAFDKGIEFIRTNNFIRAEEELQAAYECP